MPPWLDTLAIISLATAVVCAAVVTTDLLRCPQRMWIMNLVWPLTVLYAGPLGLYGYFRVGRLSSHEAVMNAQARGEDPPAKKKPFWQSVALGATHCGSGCTLGDLLAESFMLFVPITVFGRAIFGAWALDFALAFLFGIAFQYYTIVPMRRQMKGEQLSWNEGLLTALKADTLSLTAWQIGMYGWMGLVTFGILRHDLPKTGAVFWFMMQIAMLAGFLTSYPVNWWLLRKGLKEEM